MLPGVLPRREFKYHLWFTSRPSKSSHRCHSLHGLHKSTWTGNISPVVVLIDSRAMSSSYMTWYSYHNLPALTSGIQCSLSRWRRRARPMYQCRCVVITKKFQLTVLNGNEERLLSHRFDSPRLVKSTNPAVNILSKLGNM